MKGDLNETKTSPLGKRRRLAFRLLAMIIGLIAGFAILEVALRLVDYSSPEFYIADETFGYRLIPGMKGGYRREGRSFVEINSEGFRDVDHLFEKPAGVFRIAVVGDSYVEAFQVEREQMFTEYVAREVGGCGLSGEKAIEMLTFGVSGYGTAQELLLLRNNVLKFSPDLVILVVTTNNDITDNLREFKKTALPYFVIDRGELVLDTNFQNEIAFLARSSFLGRAGIGIKNNLRSVQAIGDLILKLKYAYQGLSAKPQSSLIAGQVAVPADDVGVDNQVYREPAAETWVKAWTVTEKIVNEMNREVTGRRSKLVVVTGSNGVQVLPEVAERQAFARFLGTADLLYPDRRIAEFCRTNSIPVITLAPDLGAYAEREGVKLHGFEGNIGYGHWNQVGHRVAGQLIGRQLCGIFR